MRVTADISGLGPLHRGDHVCWLVEDPTNYVGQGAALLRAGASMGQKTFVFGPEDSPVLAELAPDAVLAADPHVVFLDRGPLEPETMYAMFREQSALARDEGYDGVRVVADMDWLLSDRPTTESIIRFELLLDRVVAELSATVVCAYRRTSFDTATLGGVLSVHGVGASGQRQAQFQLVTDGVDAWRLSGEIDLAVSSVFVTALRTATSLGPSPVVVDVSELRFVDVAGMRAIASAAGSTPVQLRGASSTLRRVWRLSGFDRVAPTVQLVG